MKRIPKVIYQTPVEIDERVRELELNAERLSPNSEEHRNIMKEIAKLRIYADAKRWFKSGPLKEPDAR